MPETMSSPTETEMIWKWSEPSLEEYRRLHASGLYFQAGSWRKVLKASVAPEGRNTSTRRFVIPAEKQLDLSDQVRP